VNVRRMSSGVISIGFRAQPSLIYVKAPKNERFGAGASSRCEAAQMGLPAAALRAVSFTVISPPVARTRTSPCSAFERSPVDRRGCGRKRHHRVNSYDSMAIGARVYDGRSLRARGPGQMVCRGRARAQLGDGGAATRYSVRILTGRSGTK
jgi:hypothetical protein